MNKPVKREVTSIGIRDDKVANKGKGIVALGILVALGGYAVYKSSQNWITPEAFKDLVTNGEDGIIDEPME